MTRAARSSLRAMNKHNIERPRDKQRGQAIVIKADKKPSGKGGFWGTLG